MAGIENFAAFIAAAWLFSATPGIDTVFVINRSIAQGRRSGVFSTLGITTGVLVHTVVAGVGLSALIAQSAFAFAVVKYLGAAYLVFLGLAKLLRPTGKGLVTNAPNPAVRSTPWNDYRSGVLTNVLNPKVGLFFMAFFPQFIRPDWMDSFAPFIILGVTYAAVGLVWFLIVSAVASAAATRLQQSSAIGRWMDRISGAVFILMGTKVALGTE